jgi:hypothetical protein
MFICADAKQVVTQAGLITEGHMTRLRNLVLGGIAALAIGGAATSALAEETGTFQNRLNGATIGLPLGALPPAGLYTGLETAYLGMLAGGGNGGASSGNQCALVPGNTHCSVLPAIAQAVPLLWVPGWNFLGATYGASVVQAFYNFETCGFGGTNGGCGGGSPISGGGFVLANTTFNPITLSWNLGGGWFVSAAFNFMAPDGTRTGPATFTPNPDYWTFEPALAISYLGSGWVLSGNFFYDINSASTGACCASTTITSGNALYGDLTALWKFGKWEIGPVGYFEVQTTSDTGPGCPALCGSYQTAAAGGLIGYDFGPVDLQVWVTDSFVGNNGPQGSGGINVWSRIGFKLWGPPAPAPLVAKN